MDTLITTQRSVSSLIQDFGEGNIGIPEIQRDVVWDSEQVKGLVDSINQAYPCGSLILWEPRDRDAGLVRSMIRPERLKQFENRLPQYFLLDGQQRLTSLASVLLDRSVLRKVLAELEEEMPHLYGNLRRFPREIEATTDGGGYRFPWVSLNRLFDGSVKDDPDYRNHLNQTQRAAVDAFTQRIRDYQFPIQIVRGRDYPTVGEIFARVNSLGTQLTGAEIHLARIVPHWKGITSKFRKYRHDLGQMDYDLDLTFLMRAITVIACGVPQIKKLAAKVSQGELTVGHLDSIWRKVTRATDAIIRVLQREMKLDKMKFFTSKNVLVPLVYYAAMERRRKSKTLAMKSVLRFFLLSQLSEHYGGAGETVLRRDLRHLTEPDNTPRQGLELLADVVEREARQYYRGLRIKPEDISGVPSKNVMLLMMYIVMRQRGATDLGLDGPRSLSGIHSSEMQLHHIFPFNFMMTDKEAKRLAEGYKPSEFRSEVNDIANLTFVGPSNSVISDRPPLEYLANETTEAQRRAHFIPENRDLWRTENFSEFLAERRKLLAQAMNGLLKSLL
jgi:hypothetical protein